MNLLWILLPSSLLLGALFLLQRERRSRQTLERQLKQVSDELKRTFQRLEETQARLETTFSGMGEGVLLTDERGDIVHLNPSFREMFRLTGKVEGRSALEVLANVACDDAIREVIQKGGSVEREIEFKKPKRRIFQIHFSPMRREGRLFGVVSLFHDLTEIRRLEEVRRDFVANLSHELKTPLTAIRGYSETLLEESGSLSAGLRRHAEIIFRHAADLGQLMENLLNLSRIESGREEVALESIPPKTFVSRLFERFHVQAGVKRIELANEVSGEVPPLMADPNKLNQILSNLVDNAIKYSPAGAKVWVRSRPQAKEYEIEVGDNGPGIPLQDQERIFERFYRVDKARSRDTGGAGLGLAIVKHLVELHGGRISLESSPAQGSKFKVLFPHTLSQHASVRP